MKKNILLVTADQWRGVCLSALNHPHVKTPNFDALIADGIAFKQHYSVCVPCAPARASLLTGMYMQNHRVTRNGTPLDNRHSNIAIELSKAGYKPKLFGYTDTALDPRFNSEQDVLRHGYEGVLQGFEEGLLLPSEKPEKWLNWLNENGFDFNTFEDAFSTVSSSNDDNVARAGKPLPYNAEYSQTAFLTHHVIDYINQHQAKDDSPWCIHLSYFRPHPPFVAPPPYHNMYDPNDLQSIKQPTGNTLNHPYLKAARSPLGDWPESWIEQITTHANRDVYDQETRQIKATYYGLISKVDEYFGNLIQHLKNIGEYENTLIIMTSDHAELMGDHGLFGKRGFYKESYHIPLIIRDPLQKTQFRGHIEQSFSESIDIMPTILDWIDQPVPKQCDGKSLLPFIHKDQAKQEDRKWRNEVYWEYDFHDTQSPLLEQSMGLEMNDCKLNALYNENYLYVHFASLPNLFFDLKKDPEAHNNVIERPEYAGHVLEFTQRLLSWRMKNDERILTGYSISRESIYQRQD